MLKPQKFRYSPFSPYSYNFFFLCLVGLNHDLVNVASTLNFLDRNAAAHSTLFISKLFLFPYQTWLELFCAGISTVYTYILEYF